MIIYRTYLWAQNLNLPEQRAHHKSSIQKQWTHHCVKELEYTAKCPYVYREVQYRDAVINLKCKHVSNAVDSHKEISEDDIQ